MRDTEDGINEKAWERAMTHISPRKVIAHQWYRVDKSDGRLLAVNSVNVLRAAQGHFDNVPAVLTSGRFSTPFAIYSRGDLLTERERM